jgi:hypothetical protein
MVNNTRRWIAVVLIVVFLTVFFSFAIAMDYFPGVKTGQYVKFVYNDGAEAAFSDTPHFDWSKYEVVFVSGKEVTVFMSSLEHFKNGTEIADNDTFVINIETGQIDGTNIVMPDVLIPANLKEGDAIPPFNMGTVVSKTETRTYLGVSRSVNIINCTIDTPKGTFANSYVYDKETGVKLENSMDAGFLVAVVGGGIETTDPCIQVSSNIVETNIFGSSASKTALPIDYVYFAVIALFIVAVVAGVGLYKRRKMKTQISNKTLLSPPEG